MQAATVQHSEVEETITRETGWGDDAWICICGNDTSGGFYPCNRDGKQVDPSPEDWKEALYVCMDCGRIIEQDTLKVVGVDREGLRYEDK